MAYQCKKIKNGQYLYRGFRIVNHGYYPPDKCVWWEAIDQSTGCADFHEHTKAYIKKQIDKELDKQKEAL